MAPLALDPHAPRALLEAIGLLPGGARVLAAASRVEEPVHLVGGAVRDLLLGGLPRELDLVVEGDPVATIAALGGTPLAAHERFGTATLRLEDGTSVDLAQARSEHYPHPGALPEVQPAPLEIDLHRRDVTLNAIAVDLRTGAVSAPATGLADLQECVLRVLHPASFTDDPTRLWRLARYEVRLGADWDPVTWQLAAMAIAGDALSTVSHQRLASELRLALREPDPIGALAAARRLGLPPELELDAERLHQAQHLGDGLAPAPELTLAALASADPLLATYLEQSEERGLIAASLALRTLAGAPGRPAPLPGDAPGSQIHARFDRLPLAAVAAAPDAEAARRWLADLRHRRLAIGGEELMAAGIAQGAAVGRGLQAALAAVLDDEVHADDAAAQLRIATAAAC